MAQTWQKRVVVLGRKRYARNDGQEGSSLVYIEAESPDQDGYAPLDVPRAAERMVSKFPAEYLVTFTEVKFSGYTRVNWVNAEYLADWQAVEESAESPRLVRQG